MPYTVTVINMNLLRSIKVLNDNTLFLNIEEIGDTVLKI